MGSSNRGRKGPLILIAEDDEDGRFLYTHYLSALGYRTAEACNGREAVAKALELRPDVVVMDVSLPVMDGFEATRLLKADPHTRQIRIVALTGHAEERFRTMAEQVGVDTYLLKPCVPRDLEACLATWCGKTK
ncbi:MAG: Response regulator [Labilithrix sp.]|nr:Response regulator [Labilithrix sp.]